jgi:hypothetical protein
MFSSALKAIEVEFWNYRTTDFDLAVPRIGCRKNAAT